MKNNLQHLVSFFILALFILIAFGSTDSNNSPSNSASKNSDQTTSTEEPTYKEVGETLSTRYFDVTINKANLQDKVNTGNQFSDLKPEEGIQYLVLNITFKNTDNESRMITDGEVLINYDGKEYTFDKSETLLVEGWGILLDQINPLTSKTTNIVYKIPTEINGIAFYKPGRASSSDLILLGNIE